MVEGHIRKTENECDQLVFDLLFEKEKKKRRKKPTVYHKGLMKNVGLVSNPLCRC